MQSLLLEITQDHFLSQVVNVHPAKTILLICYYLILHPRWTSSFGKAYHDIVYVEYDIKVKRIQQAPLKIYLYKRADMDGLRDQSARYRDTFLSSDHSHLSVNDMWVSFKSEVIAAIKSFLCQKWPRQNIAYHGSKVRPNALYENAIDFIFLCLQVKQSCHKEPLQTVQSTCSKGH